MTFARLLASFASGLLGLAVLAVFIALSLIGTEPGTRWIANQATASISGLNVDAIDGTLLTEVRLTGFTWRSETLDMDIASAEIDIALLDLLASNVRLESISLRNAALMIRPSTDPAGDPFEGLPVSIQVDDGNIEQLTIATPAQSETIDSATLSASLVGTNLTFDAEHLAARNNRLAIRGSIDLALQSPAEIAVETLAPTVPGALEFSANVSSNTEQARIAGAITAPIPLQIDATFDLIEPGGLIRLSHDEGELLVDATATLDPLSVTGTLDGNVGGNDIGGNFSVNQDEATGLRASLDVRQANNSLRATLADNEISADASLPDLAQLSPDLTGALNATLSVALSPLRIVLDASGTQVLGNDIDAHFDGTATGGLARVDIRADTYSVDTEAALVIDGSNVSLTPQALELRAGGETWSLAQPGSVGVTGGNVVAEGLCLTDTGAIACVESASIAGGTVNARVTLQDLNRGALTIDSAVASVLFDAGAITAELSSPRIDLASARMVDVAANVNGTVAAPSFSITSMLTLPGLADALEASATGGRDAETFFVDSLTLSSNDVDVTSSLQFNTQAQQLVVAATGAAYARPLEVNADLSFDNGLKSGRAEARVANDATLIVTADDGDVEGQLDVQDAAALDSRLEGRLTAAVTLDAAGRWQLDLDSQDVAWQRNPFAVLKASASGTSDGSIDGRLDAVNDRLGDVSVNVSGTLTEPEFAVTARSGLIAFEAGIGVKTGESGSSAELAAATVTIAGQPWRLDQVVKIALANDQLSISAHCWQHDPASFCIDAANPTSSLVSLTAKLRRLSVGQFDLPGNGEVSLTGDVGADIRLTAAAPFEPANIDATIEIDAPDVRMQYFDDLVLDWQLALNASLQNNRLESELRFRSGSEDSVTATAVVPSMAQPDRLSLGADINVGSLAVIAAFVPQIANASGALDGKVKLTTMNGRPEIDVSAQIKPGASVVVPAGGIMLSAIEASLAGDEHRMELSVTATSGDGAASAQGFILEPLSAERTVEIKVKGEQVTAINLPDLRAIASPDLTLSYQGGGTGALRGQVVVNDGAFTLSEIRASRRTASNDVRVISRDPTTVARSAIDIELDTLVENFAIDLYGLKGNVQGDLNLIQRPGNPRRANGNLRLEDGTFSRFGQNFDVERGRLVFGGPLTNPVVDVVSSRTIEEPTRDVKVSLTLFGPANDIRSRLTSTPPMSEARALSYLVLGRPIGAASETDEQSMATAALLLGLERATGITERVRKTLGLESLAVTSGDTTTVIAGKQLSDDLFVEYSYDVLGQHSGFLLDYRLSDRLSLQTRTGEGQSMQLIYTF